MLDLIVRIRTLFALILRQKGKASFLNSIRMNVKILDVGCGNNSPFKVKSQRPDLAYVGLDVCDYQQKTDPELYADEYIIVNPDHFVNKLEEFHNSFDAVISAHNLEHCVKQKDVLSAMLHALKEGGRIYLSFPCEKSCFFPKCRGTLNFYDDPTHAAVPNYEQVISQIESNGFKIDFVVEQYRPFLLFIMGLLLEPIRFILKRNMPLGSTWAFYGFETIIWASRPVKS